MEGSGRIAGPHPWAKRLDKPLRSPGLLSRSLVATFPLRAGSILLAVAARCQSEIGLTPDTFYKVRSQEKTLLRRLKVFVLLTPLERAGSVLTSRTLCSVAGPFGPTNWVLLLAICISSSQRSQSIPKPAMQNLGTNAGARSQLRNTP